MTVRSPTVTSKCWALLRSTFFNLGLVFLWLFFLLGVSFSLFTFFFFYFIFFLFLWLCRGHKLPSDLLGDRSWFPGGGALGARRTSCTWRPRRRSGRCTRCSPSSPRLTTALAAASAWWGSSCRPRLGDGRAPGAAPWPRVVSSGPRPGLRHNFYKNTITSKFLQHFINFTRLLNLNTCYIIIILVNTFQYHSLFWRKHCFGENKYEEY